MYECMQYYDIMRNVQAKAYSMNGDNPVQGKLDDISWVKDECSSYDSNHAAAPAAMSLHYNLFSNSQATAILPLGRSI